MTRPYFEKTGDNVIAHGNGSSRPVALDKEYTVFEEWREIYQNLYRSKDGADAYKELGNEMLAWLKENGLWQHVAENVRRNGFLEIRVLPGELRWTEEEEVQETCNRTRLFLELPWEILAEDGQFLAARSGTPFCPVRRIGEPAKKIPAPAPYRLSMAFMAASPRDVQPVLNFEQEEAAILRATKDNRLELVVEESGNLELLAETVGELCSNLPDGHKGVDALHLSCHGLAERVNEPLLVLEDEFGFKKAVTAENLSSDLSMHKPKFLFLSACQTSRFGGNDKVANSMALACVKNGLPAVLGWGESVYDSQASLFASNLYQSLSNNGDLEGSIARARYKLLVPQDKSEPASDWHLARLYLGPDGGGVLAKGKKARLKLSRDHGVKEFLDTDRQQVPVASRFNFVGRRRAIQKVLAEFSSPTYAGVFVHGTGRQGKSSLAARVASRMPGHKTVVIYGPKERGGDQSVHYRSDKILEAIERKDLGGVYEIIEQYREDVRMNPARLRPALKKILDVCEDKQTPILLVVDDFEQALDKPKQGDSGIHTVKEQCAPGIAALIEAFAGHQGESRLLFTSRYKFSLPQSGSDFVSKMLYLNLHPMNEEESRKQALAKNNSSAQKLDSALELRIIKAVQGNAGLQDRLFLLGVEDEEACAIALEQLETYLGEGKDPDQEDVRAHLDDIFAKTTFDLLNEKERAILRASTIFNVPVAESVFEELAHRLRIMNSDDDPATCFSRLTAFGLWDTMPDYFDEKQASFMVVPLAAPRALGTDALSEAEIKTTIKAVLPSLFKHWGGADGSKRPFTFDEELYRLGMIDENSAVLNACSADALRSLKDKTHYVSLAESALKAVNVVRVETDPDPEFLYIAAEVCQSGGKIEPAMKMAYEAVEAYEKIEEVDNETRFQLSSARLRLARLQVQCGLPDQALAQLEKAKIEFEEMELQKDTAVTLGYIARIYVSKGKVDEALKLHLEMKDIFEQLGDTRSRAVTLGDIAKIYVDKGKVDEALKLLNEKLQVAEQLGDTRSRAVTLGDIARIYVSKGKVDEALKLLNEKLQVAEQLGDTRSRAVTLGDIARIYVSKGKVDEALKLHLEMKDIFEQLGDTRSRAVTLGYIARIYVSKGKVDEALKHYKEVLSICDDLGEVKGRAVTLGYIARIYRSKGKVDEALKLHLEMKDIFEQLGDTRSRAVTLGDIARIYVSKGKVDEALKLHLEMKDIFEQLGDTRERAVTLGDIARIYVSKGKVDEALKLLNEKLQVAEQLGDTRSRAVTLGDIARIYVSKGKVDEALKLHLEMKDIFEQLGDTRERAVTLGDIARIYISKGKVDEALKLHLEEMEISEQLGDMDGIAATCFDIAQIFLARENEEQAMPQLKRSFEILLHIGRVDGIIAVGQLYAGVLLEQNDHEEALAVLVKLAEVYEALEDTDNAAQIKSVIEKLRGAL